MAAIHSFLDEWRIIVHPTAGFAPGALQKPPPVRKCSKTATHLKPAHSRAVAIDAKPIPSKPQRFKNRHSFEKRLSPHEMLLNTPGYGAAMLNTGDIRERLQQSESLPVPRKGNAGFVKKSV